MTKAKTMPRRPRIDTVDPNTMEELYGLKIRGSAMAPDLLDGTIAICSRSAAWAKGDIVVVWFPFGVITQDGKPIRTLIRRLAMVPPDITFNSCTIRTAKSICWSCSQQRQAGQAHGVSMPGHSGDPSGHWRAAGLRKGIAMKDLIEVSDELSTARNFVEVAFLACHELPNELMRQLCAVLDAASTKLKNIGHALDVIRGARTTEADR